MLQMKKRLIFHIRSELAFSKANMHTKYKNNVCENGLIAMRQRNNDLVHAHRHYAGVM